MKRLASVTTKLLDMCCSEVEKQKERYNSYDVQVYYLLFLDRRTNRHFNHVTYPFTPIQLGNQFTGLFADEAIGIEQAWA